MSARRSSSSSASSSSDITTATATPAASSLKPAIEPGSSYTNGPSFTYDSCTYIAKNPAPYEFGKGCYLFRSCQSCLETEGCVVNDFGVCVEARRGIFNLKRVQYEYNYGYNENMNYLKAINQNLALPAAASTNAAALGAEQNWHFRAGEATYCSASDATCQECKQKNFWRGNDTSVLPDSRFCVGQNGCVCIQTCEVQTFVDPSCQWVLSSAPSPSYGGSSSYDYWTKVGPIAWEWVLIVITIFLSSLFLRCCSPVRHRQREAARKEAVRVVREELGVPAETTATSNVRLRSTGTPAIV